MEKPTDVRLPAAFLLAAFAIEAWGSLVSNSLSLLADSFFIFTEFLFFIVVLYGTRSKGACVFSLFSSLSVFLLGLLTIYLAALRFMSGSEVIGIEMPAFALAGLAAGAYAMRKARKLYRLKSANPLVHVLRKTASSLLVISGGLWIAFTGEFYVDYLFGVLIGFAAMFESILLFRDSSCLLLGTGKSKTYLFKNVNQ